MNSLRANLAAQDVSWSKTERFSSLPSLLLSIDRHPSQAVLQVVQQPGFERMQVGVGADDVAEEQDLSLPVQQLAPRT